MIDETMIAVYPNTLGFGYVVLNEKGEILDFGMVSIRPVRNDKCLNRINEIISYFQPQILIVEDYTRSNKSKRVRKLIKEINDYWEFSLNIFRYTKEQIRNTFDVFGARNKFEISRKITEAYPQLKSKLPGKRKTWEPEDYYQGIFDAMALVLTHQYLND